MGKKSRLKRERRESSTGDIDSLMWMGEEGMHAIGAGQPPSLLETAAMTEAYQQRIRNSPLWEKMVREFGEPRALEMLKEFKVEIDGTP
jgi:hypothetical protein